MRSLRLLVAALGCPAASAPAHFPEDAFARQRQRLALDAAPCVPLVAAVAADGEFATLTNWSRVHLGARVRGQCDDEGWLLVALASPAAVWEQHAAALNMSVWGIGRAGGRPSSSVALPKPVGAPGDVAYPSALPDWFPGPYWRGTVLPSERKVGFAATPTHVFVGRRG